MKLQARIGEDHYEVDVSEADGMLTAEIDGRRYEIEAYGRPSIKPRSTLASSGPMVLPEGRTK